MFDFIKKLRLQKKEIEGPIINSSHEEPPIDITVDQNKQYTKITISDFVPPQVYRTKLKEPHLTKINELSMNILWNSDKQKINKGTYYIFRQNNYLYNFLISNNKIIIDERTYYNDKTDERIIKFNLETTNFNFSSLKHDSTGSTYQTKFYSKKGTQFLGFAFSQEETAREINPLFERLELLEDIATIIPLDTLKTEILTHINSKNTNQNKK